MEYKNENKYDVCVGDYILYTGETIEYYTYGNFYYIFEVNGFLAYFKNDVNEIRCFLITKPNDSNWKFIKKTNIRNLKIQKIKHKLNIRKH